VHFTLSALYSHYASHFTIELEKKCGDLRDNLRCLICGQSYKSRHILTNHIGVKHGKINDILAKEGFKVLPCPVSVVEGRKREEMQKSLTAIKKEREEPQSSDFQEGNQIDENKSRLTVNLRGSELVVPDAEEIFHLEVPEQKVSILMQDQDPVNEEVHQSSSHNKPKGNSDKENNQTSTKEFSQTKQARGPKIVLSKKNSDQYSKEKTEERRYRIETVRGGDFECQNVRAAAATESSNRPTLPPLTVRGGDFECQNVRAAAATESPNRPTLPPLKIKAPVKSFCETLQQIEYCEREKGRKKRKRKRVKEENIFSQASLSEGDEVEIVQDTSRQLKPGGEDLHFCYECKSIFISKEGLMNHKKAECQ